MTPSSPPGCPFLAGPKIEDPQYFVGRTEALDFITSRATGPQPTSINVVGKRRIGKSSLLYHFCLTYEQRVQRKGKDPRKFVAIYLSLQDNQCKQEAGFYKAIARKLLDRPFVQGNSDLKRPLKRRSLSRQTFTDVMDEWKDRGVLPILCLDKIEKLFEKADEFNNDFYDNLRSLMDRNALMLVVTSAKRLDTYSQIHKLTSDFFNLGHLLPLVGLTEMEAQELVRLPDPNAPALSEKKQKLALQWGSREPYKLQLAGRYLWDAQQKGRSDRWAKQQFDRQVQRTSISGFNLRRWLSLPGCLSSLSLKNARFYYQNIHINLLKIDSMIICAFLIIIIFLCLKWGLVTKEQVQDLLKKVFEKISG